MLKVFRDNLKQWHWVLWGVILVFILLVFVDFGGARLSGAAGRDVVASVGELEVTLGEFQRAYQGLEQQARSTYGEAFTDELAKQLQLPFRAVDQLVQEKILLLEAERLGLEPTPEEVRKAILELPVFQDEQGRFIGTQEYERILRANRLDVTQFEQEIRTSVLRSKIVSVLADSIFVSDADVERDARAQAEMASVRYLRVAADELADGVTPSEEEIAAHFAEHQEEYREPERRSVAYLSVAVNTIRASLEISDEELRVYYDENVDEFSQAEQVRARHILLFVNDERSAEQARSELEALRRRIEAGEDFAELARQYSEDEGSKDRGGDLQFFGRGRMTPAFEEAAFAASLGSLVGPVENTLGTRTGFHLIEVTDRREAGQQPFEEVKNRIRVRELNERARVEAERRAQELYARLEQETPGSDDDLRALAEAEGIAFERTDPFARSENIPGIGAGTPFATTAFELAPDRYSEPVRIPAGWALEVLRDVEESRLPELAEVEVRVREAVIAEKQTELARSRLEEMRQRLGNETSFEELAAELETTVEDGGEFTRSGVVQGLGSQPELVAAALELETGDFGGPITTPQGLVLFEVTDRKHFDPASFAENREASREQLQSAQLNSLLGAFMAQRRIELEVSYMPWFVEQFELTDVLSLAQL